MTCAWPNCCGASSRRPRPCCPAGSSPGLAARTRSPPRASWGPRRPGAGPARGPVLPGRLLAGPSGPDGEPAAVVMEAALARCGPSLDAVLRGADDPHAQVGRFGPDAERMAAAALLEAERPPA